MNKIKYDISENREIEAQIHNFQNIDEEYIFYYDETNNIRKFWFKDENRLNIPKKDLTKNFVLGGIVHYKADAKFNLEDLKQKLHLQSTMKEIKLDHIAKGDFISCLKSKKLEVFLDWLILSDFFIHYSSLNILYWSLVDIIDSVMKENFIVIHLDLKTVFYEFIKVDLDSFLKILYKYDYPNIKREKSIQFLDEVSQFIEKNRVEFIEKYPFLNLKLIDIILYLLKQADKQDLTFIMDEKDNILIEHLFPFYLRPLGIFKNSQHIFDEEKQIEDFFFSYDLFDGENKWENIKFEDSKENVLIQISDVIVGLIGKLFDYTNNLTFEQITNIRTQLNENQIKNCSSIAKLLLKSDNHSLAFNHSIQSLIDKEKFSKVLEQFL